MTQEEFIKTLKEDKYFENFREHALHRYPVVQYYLKHYPIVIQTNIGIFDSTSIELISPTTDEEYRLINQAFNSIKEKLRV